MTGVYILNDTMLKTKINAPASIENMAKTLIFIIIALKTLAKSAMPAK
jgi:hypothetical protein